MKRFSSWLGIMAVLAFEGCYHAPTLVPGPRARKLPNQVNTAVAQSMGVRLFAETGDWEGDPTDLPSIMNPLRVTLENHTAHAIQVVYRNFLLKSATGQTWRAIPPFKMGGEQKPATPVPITPQLEVRGFSPAPFYSPFYSFGYGPTWREPFDLDESYYTETYPLWPNQLPTQDMIRRAVPEGVLAPDGELNGFLYFPEVKEDMKRVTLVATIMDARTKQKLLTLTIPFLVK